MSNKKAADPVVMDEIMEEGMNADKWKAEGFATKVAGQPITMNPYDRSSSAWGWWNYGYNCEKV